MNDLATTLVRAALALVLVGAPAAAQCDGFFAPLTRAVGGEPIDVTLRDLDGDGGLDVITAQRASDDLGVTFNLGATFGAHVDIPLGVGAAPSAVDTGELYALGGRDVAVACAGTDEVIVLRNDPVGVLAIDVALPVPGTAPVSLDVADLDGTGVDDIVVGLEGGLLSGGAGVAVSLGGGAFALLPAPSGGFRRVRRVVAADLDGDGDLDVAATSGPDSGAPAGVGRVLLWENDGAGAFTSVGGLALSDGVEALTAGDVDGDGSLDLAVTVASLPPDVGDGVWLLVNAGGALSPANFTLDGPFSDPALSFALDVVVTDLADDGVPGFIARQDVVTVGFGSERVACLHAYAGGSFDASSDSSAGTAPRAVAVGDVDGNGLPDVVVANAASDDVSIFRAIPEALAQTYGAGCPGTGGTTPVLSAVGLPVFSTTFDVVLSDAAPFRPVLVLVAFEPASLTLGGGCTLLLEQPTVGSAFTDALGTHTLPIPIPPALPAFIGLDAYLQYAVLDPAGAFANLAFTNALRIKIGI